jgi:DNA gyrase inhibitor GyrI
MKNGIATPSLLHKCYVLRVDGRINSTHRRFVDALRAGLQLKDRLPQHDIKVGVARESPKEVTHRKCRAVICDQLH